MRYHLKALGLMAAIFGLVYLVMTNLAAAAWIVGAICLLVFYVICFAMVGETDDH